MKPVPVCMRPAQHTTMCALRDVAQRLFEEKRWHELRELLFSEAGRALGFNAACSPLEVAVQAGLAALKLPYAHAWFALLLGFSLWFGFFAQEGGHWERSLTTVPLFRSRLVAFTCAGPVPPNPPPQCHSLCRTRLRSKIEFSTRLARRVTTAWARLPRDCHPAVARKHDWCARTCCGCCTLYECVCMVC